MKSNESMITAFGSILLRTVQRSPREASMQAGSMISRRIPRWGTRANGHWRIWLGQMIGHSSRHYLWLLWRIPMAHWQSLAKKTWPGHVFCPKVSNEKILIRSRFFGCCNLWPKETGWAWLFRSSSVSLSTPTRIFRTRATVSNVLDVMVNRIPWSQESVPSCGYFAMKRRATCCWEIPPFPYEITDIRAGNARTISPFRRIHPGYFQG